MTDTWAVRTTRSFHMVAAPNGREIPVARGIGNTVSAAAAVETAKKIFSAREGKKS